TTGLGTSPKTGWAKLVPELLISDIGASIEFWCDRLGFATAYQRPRKNSPILRGRKAHNSCCPSVAANGRPARSIGPTGAARCSWCTWPASRRSGGRSKRPVGRSIPGRKRNDEAAFVRGGVGSRGLDHPRTPG